MQLEVKTILYYFDQLLQTHMWYRNHVDPDQVVSEEASRFGSSLFTKVFISAFTHCFSKIGGGLVCISRYYSITSLHALTLYTPRN